MIFPTVRELALAEAPRTFVKWGKTVNSTILKSDDNVSATPRTRVMLSPWVNESLPPFQELLSAHDVARLTRRPKLVISGLVLLRRFPKKRRFRGRQIGWLRADVLEWMTRDLVTDDRPDESGIRRGADAAPHQPRLPLECTSQSPPGQPHFMRNARRQRSVR